jgi:hypothetical protein
LKLVPAIAYSNGNKAEGINDQGHRIVIQERYAYAQNTWYHVWHVYAGEATQDDIADVSQASLKQFEVDPDADYWSPVK